MGFVWFSFCSHQLLLEYLSCESHCEEWLDFRLHEYTEILGVAPLNLSQKQIQEKHPSLSKTRLDLKENSWKKAGK